MVRTNLKLLTQFSKFDTDLPLEEQNTWMDMNTDILRQKGTEITKKWKYFVITFICRSKEKDGACGSGSVIY